MTEQQLRDSFLKWREENTPPGTRIDIEADGIVNVSLHCNGKLDLFAYW